MPLTKDAGTVPKSGSPTTASPRQELQQHLPPWMLAPLLLSHLENGQPVSVSEASDATFDAWIAAQGVPVDDAGIPDWSFDDRLDVIVYALDNGLTLTFSDEDGSPYSMAKVKPERIQQELPNNSVDELIAELFEGNETAQEARMTELHEPQHDVTVAVVEMNVGSVCVGYRRDDKYYFIKMNVSPEQAIDSMADAVDAARFHTENGRPQKGIVIRDLPEAMKGK